MSNVVPLRRQGTEAPQANDDLARYHEVVDVAALVDRGLSADHMSWSPRQDDILFGGYSLCARCGKGTSSYDPGQQLCRACGCSFRSMVQRAVVSDLDEFVAKPMRAGAGHRSGRPTADGKTVGLSELPDLA